MAKRPESLEILTVPPSRFSVSEIARLLRDEYRLEGEMRALVGERDQNFRLRCGDGQQYVVKIANAAEPESITDFQIQALLHLEKNGCVVPVPRVIRTVAGEVATTASVDGATHIMRVVTYLRGRPLGDSENNARLSRKLGASLAETDAALVGFEHPGESQSLIWDMQRAVDLRSLVEFVPDANIRAAVSDCLDDFEQNAEPCFPSLRSQVVHNDMNPGNVLVSDDESPSVTGVIDFGDMLRAPLVIDVAIAASYMRSTADDAMEFLAPFVAGFDAVTPLEPLEFELLYDLVRTRLVTTIVLMNWRLSAQPATDEYMKKGVLNERSSEVFLGRLNAISRGQFTDRIKSEAGHQGRCDDEHGPR
jgi:Ser/Thr protein kinase RdoA (MazF antagonist)